MVQGLASATSGNLLERQILEPHPRPPESESVFGVGALARCALALQAKELLPLALSCSPLHPGVIYAPEVIQSDFPCTQNPCPHSVLREPFLSLEISAVPLALHRGELSELDKAFSQGELLARPFQLKNACSWGPGAALWRCF